MEKRNKIYGLIMRPVSMNQKDNSKVVHSTKHSVTSDFMNVYRDHIAALQIVAECAKVFIMKNYKKVDDWSDLEVVMEDNHPKREYIEYYKYTESDLKRWNKSMHNIVKKIDIDNKERHNPILTFKKAVLDPTDGDFSVTVNGRKHLWLSDDTVIIIANYIENKLKK